MTKPFFHDAERSLREAANQGTVTAAAALSSELRARGHNAANESDLEGTATIALEGANAVAHEFGTLASPARPVLSPAVHARREDIARSVGNAINKRLKQK